MKKVVVEINGDRKPVDSREFRSLILAGFVKIIVEIKGDLMPASIEKLNALRASGLIDDETVLQVGGIRTTFKYFDRFIANAPNSASKPTPAPRPKPAPKPTLAPCPKPAPSPKPAPKPNPTPHPKPAPKPNPVLNPTSNVNGNLPTMSFARAIGTCIGKYACFNGRASRSEYWWWTLFVSLVYMTFIRVSPQDTWVETVVVPSLGLFLPTCAVSVRRLHDVGLSGWTYFWLLIPYLNILSALVILSYLLKEGENSANQYGKKP